MANFEKWKPTAGSQMGTLSSVPQWGGGPELQTLFLTDRVCKCYVRKIIQIKHIWQSISFFCPYLVQGIKFYWLVSWEEFNVDDDVVFVALEGYLVCPEKLVGGPNRKRVKKIFLSPSYCSDHYHNSYIYHSMQPSFFNVNFTFTVLFQFKFDLLKKFQ